MNNKLSRQVFAFGLSAFFASAALLTRSFDAAAQVPAAKSPPSAHASSQAALYSLNEASRQLAELQKSHDRTVSLNAAMTKLFEESRALLNQQSSLMNETGLAPSVRSDKLKNIMQKQATLNETMMKVQMAMQRENLVFTSVSNVLKTRHDEAKNSISNVR